MRFMLSYTEIINDFLMGFPAVTLHQYNNLLYNLQFRLGRIMEVFMLHAFKHDLFKYF